MCEDSGEQEEGRILVFNSKITPLTTFNPQQTTVTKTGVTGTLISLKATRLSIPPVSSDNTTAVGSLLPVVLTDVATRSQQQLQPHILLTCPSKKKKLIKPWTDGN